MVSLIFHEKEWRFECLTTSGYLLAAVYDHGQAETLQEMYNTMEAQDKDTRQQTQQEEEMAEMGWRCEDNKGGE